MVSDLSGKNCSILFFLKKFSISQRLHFWFTAVGNIDTSGISMLEEVKKTTDRRGLKVFSPIIYLHSVKWSISNTRL